MSNDVLRYHLRSHRHETLDMSYTWCGWIVANYAIALPPFDGRQRICQRCCPRPDILNRWIEQYAFGA